MFKWFIFSDCQFLIHAAFNDKDADALIADKHFMDRLNNVLAAEEQAIGTVPCQVDTLNNEN